MLSKFDDFPIHQTAAPIAHPVSGDRNVYDRYWFNGIVDDDKDLYYFGIGAARYANAGIQDCGFSIVRNGEQHAFHASRRAPVEPTDLSVGPFSIDVVEPMRRIRVKIDENDTGISCDLLFTARTACIEEGRQRTDHGVRPIMDVTRFAQFGSWEGEITYDNQTVQVDGARVRGVKDRSWGQRPFGVADPGIAPQPPAATQVFFLWAPIHWADRCTHFGVFERANGFKWHQDGAIVPVYADPAAIPGAEDPNTEILESVEHYLDYIPGTRRAGHGRIELRRANGEVESIDLEPRLVFRMKGIGYMHPEWGHGLWKGELAIGGESWKCDEVDPMAFDVQHIQQIVRATSGDQVGIGVLEQISFGPHDRYGFTELLDPAR